MKNPDINPDRVYFIQHLMFISAISIVIILILNQLNDKVQSTEQSHQFDDLLSQAQNISGQFDQQIEQIMAGLIDVIPTKTADDQVWTTIERLKAHRPCISFVNYFNVDGRLIYSHEAGRYQWQSNQLNKNWYRKLIREWKPVLSAVHQSPISPFPLVMTLAIPVRRADEIDGFWLVYLSVDKINSLLPQPAAWQNIVLNVWYDNTGTIIDVKTRENAPSITKSMINGNWWHLINDSKKNNGILAGELSDTQFLYGKATTAFGDLSLVVLASYEELLAAVEPVKDELQFWAIISLVASIVMIFVLLNLWRKKTYRLENFREASGELQHLNDLLQTKTGDLLETNEKLNALTAELAGQKDNLLKLNNKLLVMHKYLDFLTVPVFTFDEQYKIDFINKAAENEISKSLEKIKGRVLHETLTVNERKELITFLKQVKNERTMKEMDISFVQHENEKQFHILCDYLTLEDWSGYILTMTDLTEIIKMQKSITEKNRFLEKSSGITQLFLTSADHVLVLSKALEQIRAYTQADDVLYYHYQNTGLKLAAHANTKVCAFDAELPLDRSIAGSTLIDGQPALLKNLSRLPKNFIPVEKNWPYRSMIFKPVIINQAVTGVIVIAEPAEEVFAAFENNLDRLLMHFEIGLSAQMSHQQLEEKNKELARTADLRAQLLRSTTHGLNTPLSTMRGYLKLMKIKYKAIFAKYPDLWGMLEKLDSATEVMEQKTNMFLDLARLNRNDLKINLQSIDVSSILHPVLEMITKEAQSRSIKIHHNCKNINDFRIRTDRERLKFALQTILLNSLRYAPLNDDVQVKISIVDHHLQISFSDHGPQIKKENAALMDAEFLSSDLAKERLHSGDSLSISLAVKLIRKLGGEIQISSSKKLTTHTLVIPLISEVSNEQAA